MLEDEFLPDLEKFHLVIADLLKEFLSRNDYL
jgi:hypothetical protein